MPNELPIAKGSWTFDPDHSSVAFKVRHFGLTNVHGRFNDVVASLDVGDDLASTQVTATIAMASINTNQADRDEHLRGTDLFSAELQPTMTFASTVVRGAGESHYEADGTLTVNGITKPITLGVEFTGAVVHPGDGKLHAGFSAKARVQRDEFGVDFNLPLGVEAVALGKRIDVEIEAQFTAPDA